MQPIPDRNPSWCSLSEVGFIRLEGKDTERFLNSQLSQNIQTFGTNTAPLAAWHSAAGKVKAIVHVLRLDDCWLLITASDLVDPLVTDLQRFVLRDDVTISNAGDQWQAAALIGKADSWLRECKIGLTPESCGLANARGLRWLRLGPTLVYALGSPAALAELATTLPQGESADAELEATSLGLPQLTAALQDRFVPQMLNLDLLGALNETKGCYPGQEIIARTQNLGTVKRRMLRFSADLCGAPDIGKKIMTESDTVVGEVIRAASANGRVEILAVTQLDSADQTLSCEVNRTAALQREPLPYGKM
jgi:folate-binding protein YgfZ